MQKIKLIIFDLWDTLARHTGGFSGTEAMVEKTGVNIPLRKFVKIFERCVQSTAWEDERDAYKCLCREIGLRPTDENADMLIGIRRRADGKVALFDHVIPMLERLRKDGYETALLSNSSVFAIDMVKRETGLMEYMDHVLFPFQVGVIKPDPMIFEKMLEIASCRPEEAVMVGDSEEDDIIPARKLGIGAIRFEDYGQLKEDFKKISIEIP